MLDIYVDSGSGPELVFQTDERVTRIGLNGPTGEAGALGVAPNVTSATLVLQVAPSDGTSLEEIEAAALAAEQSPVVQPEDVASEGQDGDGAVIEPDPAGDTDDDDDSAEIDI